MSQDQSAVWSIALPTPSGRLNPTLPLFVTFLNPLAFSAQGGYNGTSSGFFLPLHSPPNPLGEPRMSKNITVVVALFVVALLSANSAILGQANPMPNYYIEMSGLIDVNSSYPGNPGKIVTKVSDLNASCNVPYRPNFPDSHITRKENPILHYVEISIDQETFDHPEGIPITVNTAAAANRLWDTVYHAWGYTKLNITDSIDPSMNCHGYSTGRGAWMSLQPARDDDYQPTTIRDHLVPGAIFATTNSINILNTGPFVSHSSNIDAVNQIAGTHDLSVNVVEKFRVSALYMKTFTMKALCPNKDSDPMAHVHTGPCSMVFENAPLPWLSTGGFYRKLP